MVKKQNKKIKKLICDECKDEIISFYPAYFKSKMLCSYCYSKLKDKEKRPRYYKRLDTETEKKLKLNIFCKDIQFYLLKKSGPKEREKLICRAHRKFNELDRNYRRKITNKKAYILKNKLRLEHEEVLYAIKK